MEFYNHYKNKPYKYLGIVRHSETQEDMALYECRYENASSKIWVRPKGMFFENVNLNGEEIPRFRKIAIDIQAHAKLTDEGLSLLGEIYSKTLGKFDREHVRARLECHSKILLLLAKVEGQFVGYKLGYALGENVFYSWLGGVLPEYQGVGIAKDLIKAQELWCLENKFKKIQTKTRNEFLPMLLLNLKSDFKITGFESSSGKDSKIILEKQLT